MATEMKLETYDNKERAFLISLDNVRVKMKTFTNGIMHVEPLTGNHHIDRIIKKAIGCFEMGSNVYGIKAIIIEGNGRNVFIDRNSRLNELLEQLKRF